MSTIKLLSIEESIKLDKLTIDGGFVSAEELMDNAGKCIAFNIINIIKERQLSDKILFFAGKGNNGGDAFVAAKYLNDYGFNPSIILIAKEKELKNEALLYYEKFKDKLDINIILNIHDIMKKTSSFNPQLVVDGILGSGFIPPLKDLHASIIKFLNECHFFTVSIDLPSGISSKNYENSDNLKIIADTTLTIGSIKKEFFLIENIKFCGKIKPLDIGFPNDIINSFHSPCVVYSEQNSKGCLKRRVSYCHKGTFGHVLIIGGKKGFTGALLLSGLAALRSGSGLLTLCTEENLRNIIHSQLKEAMTISNDELLYLRNDIEALKKYKAIAIGPGFIKNENSKEILEFILQNSNQPIVIDADALNIIADNNYLLDGINREIVLTPHLGEAARLLNCKIRDIEKDPFSSAELLMKKYNANIILKGSNTIVQFKDSCFLHLIGSPLMATGGMGDVLTGICVSLLGQGLSIKEALNIAVYLHGKSGEILETKQAPYGILASELANQIPYTIRNLVI